jgi:hypothetical protein
MADEEGLTVISDLNRQVVEKAWMVMAGFMASGSKTYDQIMFHEGRRFLLDMNMKRTPSGAVVYRMVVYRWHEMQVPMQIREVRVAGGE